MELQPIRDRAQIVEHLESLIQGQNHLTVTFGGEEEEFLTQVLELETEEQGRPSLVLDQPVPEHGHVRAQRHRTLQCIYNRGEESHRFSAIIREIRETPHPCIVVAMPSEIVPHQQRRHYRVEPFTRSSVKFKRLAISDSELTPEELAGRCVIVDVSVGGVSFNTDIPRAHLEPGTVVPKAELEMPDGEVIRAQMIVRDVRANRSGHYRNRVGGEFFMLSKPDAETLSQFVIETQREDIRRYKRELE